MDICSALLSGLLAEEPNLSFSTAAGRIMGLVFIVMGILTIIVAVAAWRRAVASEGWPSATGMVLRTRVEPLRMYHPKITYEYRVEGVAYRGDRLTFDDIGYAYEDEARAELDHYPVGSEIEVYYAPGNPKLSVLRTGRVRRDWGWYGRIAGGVLLTALGALLALSEVTPSRQPEDGVTWSSWVYGIVALTVLVGTLLGLLIWARRRRGYFNPMVSTAIASSSLAASTALMELGDADPFQLVSLPFLAGFWLVGSAVFFPVFRRQARSRRSRPSQPSDQRDT